MTHYLLPIYLVVAAVALLVWSRLFSKKTPLPPKLAAASLQSGFAKRIPKRQT